MQSILQIPNQLRGYLQTSFEKALKRHCTGKGDEKLTEKSGALLSALEETVRAEITEIEKGSMVSVAVGPVEHTEGVKQLQKRYSEACRRRGSTIAKRIERKVDLASKILSCQGQAFSLLIKEAEEAVQRSAECGRVITQRHKRLREAVRETVSSRGSGSGVEKAFDEAWSETKTETRALTEYAECMSELAQAHWQQEAQGDSRIDWCLSTLESFFNRETTLSSNGPGLGAGGAIRLLDVGSCYDPFRGKPGLEVMACDLQPAQGSPKVYRCDFLELEISSAIEEAERSHQKRDEKGEIPLLESPSPHQQLTSLPSAWFDVVVFSLVLSYVPSGSRRADAVWKARRLLRPGGLLLIVTPQSTIRLSNSVQLPILREWRGAMEAMGLVFHKCEHLTNAKQIGLAYHTNQDTPATLDSRPKPGPQPMRIAFDQKPGR